MDWIVEMCKEIGVDVPLLDFSTTKRDDIPTSLKKRRGSRGGSRGGGETTGRRYVGGGVYDPPISSSPVHDSGFYIVLLFMLLH